MKESQQTGLRQRKDRSPGEEGGNKTRVLVVLSSYRLSEGYESPFFVDAGISCMNMHVGEGPISWSDWRYNCKGHDKVQPECSVYKQPCQAIQLQWPGQQTFIQRDDSKRCFYWCSPIESCDLKCIR